MQQTFDWSVSLDRIVPHVLCKYWNSCLVFFYFNFAMTFPTKCQKFIQKLSWTYFFFKQTLNSKNSLENSGNSKWQNTAILIDIHKWHVQCKWCDIVFCFWQFVQKTHNLDSFLVNQLTPFIFLYYLQISWFANVSFDGVVSNWSVEWTWKRHQSFIVICINLKRIQNCIIYNIDAG